jgi:hypothetical protein
LGNTDDPLYHNGDRVAAIVAWEPPEIWADATPEQLNAALDIIATPPAGWLYAPSRRGRTNNRWAGQVLVDEIDCTEKQASSIVAAWLKSGLLYEETYRDTSTRRDKQGVRVNDTKRPTGSANSAPYDC